MFVALPLGGVLGVLRCLEHTTQSQQPIQSWRLGLDLPMQLAHELKDLLQGFGIDSEPALTGWLSNRQLDGERAATHPRADFLAQLRLEPLKAGCKA